MNSVLQNLINARAVIADEDNWCQGYLHHPYHSNQHCALGALSAAGVMIMARERPEIEALAKCTGDHTTDSIWSAVAVFNNSHIRAEVLALFDAAIAAERAKEPASDTDISVFEEMLSPELESVIA